MRRSRGQNAGILRRGNEDIKEKNSRSISKLEKELAERQEKYKEAFPERSRRRRPT